MNTRIDPDTYKSCERAFLRELAKTVCLVIERTALTSEEKAELGTSLTYAVAAHLSGSSFGGRVTGDEIYPKLGFWKGESDDALYFGDGSTLHEQVPSVLDELVRHFQR
ncbi:hypothetical protein BGE01nite_52280 [Brevifollis gellanilyticus]|uniref:Uncharacterized protein n=1 Tax=Brevifollis gellanilyticus TaxID=748831 RepID=A0A512MGR0_9BACT|nr:hypothetical protein BGE01nite_52280 [Brevifollis gellanilyticus]